MVTMVIFLLIMYLLIDSSIADNIKEDMHPNTMSRQENDHSFAAPETENAAVYVENIESALEKIVNIAALAEKSRKESVLPDENVEMLNNQMVKTIEDIIEEIKNPLNANKFLNSKGVDRIITPMIGINYEPLKKQLLILINTLFIVAPATTNALIPISVIDKLLDIFEHDNNLALKAHALDIMYIWLPKNPEVQARVMRLKGLEPFYQQVSKLDNTVIHKLLNLFNKILEEHIEARGKKSQRNKEDYEKMKLYEMIGLVERMDTSQVCNGLFNILEALMTFTDDDTQLSSSMFELVKNIKPFCLKMYKGKDREIKLFDELNKYVTDPNKIDVMRNRDLNITEVQMVIGDFAKTLKENVRDEF